MEVEIDSQLSERLLGRIGAFHLSQRVLREKDTYRDPYRHRDLEEIFPVAVLLEKLLKILLLWKRGVGNAADIGVSENMVAIDALPDSFEGFRILHLSDMHFAETPGHAENLFSRLEHLDYDLCVLTGDYSPGFVATPALQSSMQQLRDIIATDIYAVLGNHDSIFMVPWMEDLGITILLNESALVGRGGEEIVIAGVDDYHRFRLSNLEKATSGTLGKIVVLLNHSPEQYRQAAYAGVDLYLTGHTHGGQICLPNGFAPKLNIECGRAVGQGVWWYKDMKGYTSRGTGTSLVNVRFNCPPEIVIHELTRA